MRRFQLMNIENEYLKYSQDTLRITITIKAKKTSSKQSQKGTPTWRNSSRARPIMTKPRKSLISHPQKAIISPHWALHALNAQKKKSKLLPNAHITQKKESKPRQLDLITRRLKSSQRAHTIAKSRLTRF